MTGPVLGETKIEVANVRGQCSLSAFGGLQYITGNAKPHFSLTCHINQGRRELGGGANHTVILRSFPGLKDLAALHLSDIDGLPMHAVGNGWYFLCGTVVGGHGAKFHAGNTSNPLSPDECLRVLASHFRISLDEARGLSETIVSEDALAAWVETQKPRFKAEAVAAIAKHGLQVFGDRYEAEAA